MSSTFYRGLYRGLILPLIWGGSNVLSPFVPKIRAGLAGRRGLLERVAAFRKSIGDKAVVLFHCASAGELESLKPLAREFDRKQVAIAVSFFSPSAKAAAEKSDEFDFADFSPIDSVALVTEYLSVLHPQLLAITKHDVWPNTVWIANALHIPVFLVNGNFHAESLKSWPGLKQFHAGVYSAFAEIMTVSEEDAIEARRVVPTNVRVEPMGDSRFDRVMARAAERRPLPKHVEDICRGRTVIVIGSSHPDDEQLMLPVLPKLRKRIPNLLTVIVPHDPSNKARARIVDMCGQHNLKIHDLDRGAVATDIDVLLINRTGILADLYRVGHAAYVGGGFGQGVHSVLEPMANGLPVLCGPKIVVSHEARIASQDGIVTIVTGRKQAEAKLLEWLASAESIQALQSRARAFVAANAGVAQRIAKRLKEALRG